MLVLYLVCHVALTMTALQAAFALALDEAPGAVASGIFLAALCIPIAYFAWAFSRIFPGRPWLAAAGSLAALAGGVALWFPAMVVLIQLLRR